MASKSLAISFQYLAICSDSSGLVFVAVPFIKVKVLGRIGESAFAETGVISCLQHSPETIECARQVGIVTQPGTQSPWQSRLVGINLPGMYINYYRQTLFLHPLQSQSRVHPGQQSKITASSDWHIVSRQAEGRNGKLGHRPGRRLKPERSTRRTRHSIAVMMDGKNTGVVGKTELGQDIERPNGTVDHRVGRCAVSGDRLAADLLDYVLGAPSIFFEFNWFQFIDQPVPVGMTGQLMSPRCDLAYQRRKAFSNPPQNEVRRVQVELCHQLQEAASVSYHAARIAVPAPAIYHIGKGFRVEIVFHVHRHHIP